MASTFKQSIVQTAVAVVLTLAIATAAFADPNLFAPPPDPTAMAPIELPVESAAEPTATAPVSNPTPTSIALAVFSLPPTTESENFIQQCAAQTDPANFSQGPPVLLPDLSASSAAKTSEPSLLAERLDRPAIPVRQPPPPPDLTGAATAQPSACTQTNSSCAQQCNSCNSSCDNCDDCCCRNWWVNVDYLAMWIQANHLPPLVTTSPAGTPRAQAGVLPAATILFGNDYVDGGARNGGRVTLGYWLDDDHNNAVEASWFTVGQPTGAANFFADSSGLPILARPFTSGGIPNAQLAAYPGVVMGEPQTPATIGITTKSSMDFAEIVFQHVFDRDECDQFSWTAGYRHLEFREGMRISENIISTDPTNPNYAPGTSLNVLDQFQANNDFEGGQFGAQFMRQSGSWTLNGLAKLGLGNVHEYVNISGNTTVTDPLGNVTHQPGLLAQHSNDGVHSRNVFAFLPEMELNLHYQLTNQIDLSVGYTFLLITRVARVGDQIDTNVSSTQLPTAIPPSGVGNSPTEVLRDTSLWAQGISGGIELRF